MGKVMIINYGVTQQGLENQLLNVVGEGGTQGCKVVPE